MIAALCIWYIVTRHRILLPERRHFVPEAGLYRELAAQGLAMGVMNVVGFTGTLALQRAINQLGYLITICQMVLVLICYTRNRKNASRSMRRVLIQTFPVSVMCIAIQRMYPEIMLNSFIMSMVVTVLFLSFQGQPQGVHNLTKLNDRHRFFEYVDVRIRKNEPFQVFLINLKNYGVINQKYGHMVGDEVLYHFAFALEKLIRNSEAFHMNGTVFALVIPYQSQQAADHYLSTLLSFLEGGMEFAGDHIHIDYVAVEYLAYETETDAKEFYEKLEYAAAKAYRQKERYIRCTPGIGEEMLRRRYLIERLQHIDREHGYQVWYQPICCLATGKYCSMEALIRLREPDGSIVSPAEFIPLAEETGIIASITWFVVEEVCRFLAANPQLDVSVGVNMPMAQMIDNGFGVRLNSIVDRYKVEHRRICMEFTERAILENFQQVRNVMNQFAEQGYRFYLDDFGAGYSNFNCLLQLPFHLIKLDAQLIQLDMEGYGYGCLGLTQKLTEFLHELRLPVIAEGVESRDEIQKLRGMGIDRVQGYAFARPMPDDELLKFYRDQEAAAAAG